METMTRPPHTPRPAPPYRPPVARGQSYPPLGFADDGTPRYEYTAPSPSAAAPPDQPPASPAPPASPPPPPRRDPVRQVVTWLVAALAGILVVAFALTLFSTGGSDTADQIRSAPPASQPLDDPYLDGNEDPNPPESVLPPQPSTPRSLPPAPRSARPQGPLQEVRYEVITEVPATVFFSDQGSSRWARIPAGGWELITKTQGNGQITVFVEKGSTAECTIAVDGREVAAERLDPTSGPGILTCRG